MRRSLCIALSSVLVAGAVHTRGSAQVDWSTAWMVQYRIAHGMAFDLARSRLVVFGGTWNGQSLGDTWEWDGTNWTQVFPSVSPSARRDPTMTYDAARGVVVMFGGSGPGSVPLRDTWEWDGTTWTQRFPASQPPACFGLTYDASRSRVVGVFLSTSPPISETQIWEWDGVDWSLRQTQRLTLFPASPIVYHSAQQVSVLTGLEVTSGFPPTTTPRTFLWNGVSLTPAAAPPESYFPLMVDDPVHGYVLGMGSDTWAWDGSQWINVSGSTVSNQVTFDALRQRPIALGGGTTLEWDGATWSTLLPFPSPPSTGFAGPNLAYDSVRQRIVFAGQGTWEWNGTSWQQQFPLQEPPTRTLTATAYSRALARIVLFGGYVGSTAVNDTWLWDGTIWASASPTASPGPRARHDLAYDSKRKCIVLFGGYDAGPLGDTWEFDGITWTQRSPTVSPPARSDHVLAFDEARGVTVLFGGASPQAGFRDTWEWDGTTWEQRFSARSPSTRAAAAMAFDSSRDRVVLFGGINDDNTKFDDTWEWDGTDWTQRSPVNAPPGRYRLALAYDSARREIICYGGVGSTQDTWIYAPTDPATFTTSQSGCAGSGGTPALTTTSPSGYPWLGDPFAVVVTSAAPGHAVAMAAGFSNTSWAGVSLPLALAFVGMPGCQAYTSAELLFPVGIADPTGTATWNLGTVPNDAAFLGARFFTQAWIADSVNPAGFVVSDLGEAVVGGK
jgi:hypothetical protein